MRNKSVAIRVLTPVFNKKGEVELQVQERFVRLPLTREDRLSFQYRFKA